MDAKLAKIYYYLPKSTTNPRLLERRVCHQKIGRCRESA